MQVSQDVGEVELHGPLGGQVQGHVARVVVQQRVSSIGQQDPGSAGIASFDSWNRKIISFS